MTEKTTPTPDQSRMVHVGEEDWLFLVGGSNDPLFLYRRSLGRWRLLRRWVRLLRERARRCEALGIRYLHVPVPEKTAVYADRLGALRLDTRLGLARPLARLAPESCLDLVGPLRAGRAREETYMKADTHWTPAGCRIAHDLVCATLGARPPWRLEDRPALVMEDQSGDLGSKTRPPRGETIVLRPVLREARRTEANALLLAAERGGDVLRLHQGAQLVFRNDGADADPRRLVLFGDSFASYLETGLTAMLAETFREVHFVWYPQVDWGYVERVRPDVLLTQIAERFMILAPPVRERFDGVDFAARKLAALGEA